MPHGLQRRAGWDSSVADLLRLFGILPEIGGEILKNSGYKYWREVYYHGDVNSSYESSFLDILNLADMQIDKGGREVGFGKRLEDIGRRYGFKSDVYISASILIEKLKELK